MWLKSYVLRLSRLFLPATICFPTTFNFFWKTFFSYFFLEKVTTTLFGTLHLPHFFSIYVYSFWFVAIDCKIFIQLKKIYDEFSFFPAFHNLKCLRHFDHWIFVNLIHVAFSLKFTWKITTFAACSSF